MKQYVIIWLLVLSCHKICIWGSSSQTKVVNIFEAVEQNDSNACKEYFSQPNGGIDVQNDFGWTPLHLACNRDFVEICKLFLERKVNIEAKDRFGRTPLNVALGEGVCTLLLEHGAYIDAQDTEGLTLLHKASRRCDLKICKFLLARGANKDLQDHRGFTPLHWSCADCESDYDLPSSPSDFSLGLPFDTRLPHWFPEMLRIHDISKSKNSDDKIMVELTKLKVEITKLLLENGANIEARTNEGHVPLHVVCANPGPNSRSTKLSSRNTKLEFEIAKLELAVIRLLLENGANREARTNKGHVPLHFACAKDKVEVCQFLLRQGAKIDAQDNNGFTPLHITCSRDNNAVFQVLLNLGANVKIQNKDGATPLYLACKKGSVYICRTLLEKGAEIDVRDNDGNTPLHHAITHRAPEIFRLLIEKGANKELANKEGNTPLHEACDNNDLTACSFLLGKGANVNARTKLGATPLILASKKGFKKIVDLLLDQSKIVKELKEGTLEGTALHWACLSNHLELCHVLLRAGLNPNETANTLSMLHLAVKTNDTEMVDLFLEKQRDCNKPDKNGSTALHLACELGSDSIIEKFLANKDINGININAKTHTRKTPLHTAIDHNKPEAVRLLLMYGALPNELDSFNKTPLMLAAEKRQLESCTHIKAKISIVYFNGIKRYLGSLVRGHEELEKLFEVYTDLPALPDYSAISLVESQESGFSSIPPSQDAVDQVSEEEGDTNTLDQVSEVGTFEN